MIITGKVTMYGENTGAWHIQNGANEVIVSNTPELKIGDIVVYFNGQTTTISKNNVCV